MLVISNRPRACASSSSNFEITHTITPWIVLHLVQLLLLVAAEGKYHPMCYARVLRTRRNPIRRLRKRQSRGQMFRGSYNSTPAEAFWSPHQLGQKYQLQSRVYKSNRFKDRIQEFLGDTATFGLYAEFISTSELSFASFSEQVLEQNVSHENYLNYRMDIQ